MVTTLCDAYYNMSVWYTAGSYQINNSEEG